MLQPFHHPALGLPQGDVPKRCNTEILERLEATIGENEEALPEALDQRVALRQLKPLLRRQSKEKENKDKKPEEKTSVPPKTPRPQPEGPKKRRFFNFPKFNFPRRTGGG